MNNQLMRPLNDAEEVLRRRAARLQQLFKYVSGMRCSRPDFLIAGAQKGGTTSAYSYLTQHPQVIPAIRKEVHFFEDPLSRRRGPRWYGSFFPTNLHLRLAEWRTGCPVVTGEATPYMPHRVAPRQLHGINPAAKLVFLLRDPAERALSHYMQIRRSYPELERLSFSEAIRAEGGRILEDVARIARDENHNDLNYRIFSYVQFGMYGQHLARWLQWFPREQIFVTESERFFSNPAQVMREITAFLGLSPFDYDSSRSHNVGGYTADISREDRAYLQQAFAEDLKQLRSILGNSFGAGWSV